MLPILSKRQPKVLPEVTLRTMAGPEFAVAITPDLEVGRIAERKNGWAAYGVCGYVGQFSSQAAAVAALTLRIVDDCPF